MSLPAPGGDDHCWHIFSPLLPLDEVALSRKDFVDAMHARGIGVGVHYPAIHQLSLYRELGYGARSHPNAERIGRETVTLPLFPGMTDADVDRVCHAAREVLVGAKKRRRA
jgi:dTDP-4-amino-4,6-dideoxygalactose transaminase